MACMEPQVGNIYKGATLIGYRDPVTLEFTAEGATDWELTEDKYVRGNTCVIVPQGGEVPPPFDGLDFSYSSNSQYLAILTGVE